MNKNSFVWLWQWDVVRLWSLVRQARNILSTVNRKMAVSVLSLDRIEISPNQDLFSWQMWLFFHPFHLCLCSVPTDFAPFASLSENINCLDCWDCKKPFYQQWNIVNCSFSSHGLIRLSPRFVTKSCKKRNKHFVGVSSRSARPRHLPQRRSKVTEANHAKRIFHY